MKKIICLFLTQSIIAFAAGSIANADWVITQVTDNFYYDEYPQLNDSGQVVWRRSEGEGWDIFYWDSSSTTRLTDNEYHDMGAQINNSGHVVWKGGGGGMEWDIFYWDGSCITCITDNNDGVESFHINDSGQVVWEGWGGRGWCRPVI